MPQEWNFPGVLCQFEEPDILISRTGGGGLGAEAVYGIHRITGELQKKGFLYSLLELGGGTHTPPETKEALKNLPPSTEPYALVFYGGNLGSRSLVLLTMRALVLLGKLHAEVAVVKDEAAARAWVVAHRAQRKNVA